ncbi:phytanoyl-CoA dioxygenase family protein [Sphingomonas radiodurans]|uniref:phytanoyl-CoA dioxygenase family protein n=1 Tax=Sphingomonas radiodurans TaxID=2890321 RepID=UPI001E4B71AD|nr:phytanoyl-CoA dioxygenase family protein [Sphingomonas radiodurans]WBH15265.1 phytanoyl-CoA dioxygenase family protein [Sphingomonas radiodurans]
MNFDTDGAALHAGAALSILEGLRNVTTTLSPDRAGIRLHGNPALRRILATPAIGAIAKSYLGPAARPVRAILFDKTPATNWSLGWHQDRTIVVRERHEVPGFGPWSRKADLQHVEPPFAVIEAMLTLRIHLDDVPADNAPLLIARGSHGAGRLTDNAIEALVSRCDKYTCLASAGDVWAYRTAIVHASAAAQGSDHRRVLQVDYAASALPSPLAWLGI